MGGRDDFDVTAIIADVVAPALASVFRPGEVESVRVAWEESVRLPDGTQSAPRQLNVHLVVHGEQHSSNLWTLGNQVYNCEELRAHLADEFSAFVAESTFGWGQQR